MANVDIDINANVNNALKGFKRLSSEAGKAVSGIGSAFTDLKVIASGAIAAIGFGKIVQAAAQQEQAVQKLNTALALSGELSEETTQEFLDFTAALQANSTVGDEVSLGLVGLAKSFGATNEQAKQILQTAADLSAVTGESLESSVRNLSKTLGGLKGELGETQPELRGLTKEQLRAGKGIDILNKKFAGASKALTRTFSGALQQTSNSFGDLVEEFGEFVTLNPTVVAALNLFGEVFRELGRTIEDNRDSIEQYISAGIRGVIEVVPTAVRVVREFFRVFSSVSTEITGFRAAVARDLEAVTSSFDDFFQRIEDLTNLAFAPFITAAETAKDKLVDLGIISGETRDELDKIDSDIATVADGLGTVFDKPIENIQKYRQTAEEEFALAKEALAGTSQFFDDIAVSTQKLGEKLDGLEDKARNSTEQLKNLSETNVEVTISADRLTQDTRTAAQVIDDTETNVKRLREELTKLFAKRATPEDDIAVALKGLRKIEEVLNSTGVMSAAQAATLIEVRKEAEQFISKTVNERNQKALADQKKIADDAKKNVQDITAIGVAGLISQIGALAAADDLELKQGERLEFDRETLDVQKIAVDIETPFEKSIDNLVSIFPDSFAPVFNAIGSAVSAVFPSGDFVASVVGAGNELLQGAEGARNFLQTGGSLIADAFLPGLGQAVGPLIGALSQGPDFVREQIDAFTEALPALLDNIIKAIPVFIEALADAAPEIVVAIVKASPAIARALTVALVKIGPLLAKEFINAFLEEIDTAFGTDLAVQLFTNIERFESVAEGLQSKYVSSVEDASDKLAKNTAAELNKITSGFEDFGGFIADALKEGGQSFVDAISEAFGPVFEGFREFFEEVGESIAGLGTALSQALKDGAAFLINGLGQALQFIVTGIKNVLNGAKEFIGGILEALASLGPALLEVFKAGANILGNVLQEGFDKLASGATEFFDNILTAINSILEPFGRLFEGVGELLGKAFGKLTEALDAILSPVSEAFAVFADAATNLINYDFAPIADFAPELELGFEVSEITDSITNAFSPIIQFFKNLSFDLPSVGGGGGGGGGGFLGGLTQALPFADGGRIPEGFPNDSFPARLSSGEEVIDRSTSEDLRAFLTGQGGGQNVSINLQIGEKQLADVLVNLNRQGFRVTA